MGALISSQRDLMLAAVRDFPLHKQFGFTIDALGEGTCDASCQIGPEHLNIGGVVHGGVMYLLLDVAAYCAAVTLIPEGTNPVTHDLHVSVMRPTPRGARLELQAAVRKAGRSLYFIDVDARVGDKPVASARVTKSVVSVTPSRA